MLRPSFRNDIELNLDEMSAKLALFCELIYSKDQKINLPPKTMQKIMANEKFKRLFSGFSVEDNFLIHDLISDFSYTFLKWASHIKNDTYYHVLFHEVGVFTRLLQQIFGFYIKDQCKAKDADLSETWDKIQESIFVSVSRINSRRFVENLQRDLFLGWVLRCASIYIVKTHLSAEKKMLDRNLELYRKKGTLTLREVDDVLKENKKRQDEQWSNYVGSTLVLRENIFFLKDQWVFCLSLASYAVLLIATLLTMGPKNEKFIEDNITVLATFVFVTMVFLGGSTFSPSKVSRCLSLESIEKELRQQNQCIEVDLDIKAGYADSLNRLVELYKKEKAKYEFTLMLIKPNITNDVKEKKNRSMSCVAKKRVDRTRSYR